MMHSFKIVGIPQMRYTPADHDPHLLVQSTFWADFRWRLLETPALGLAEPRSER